VTDAVADSMIRIDRGPEGDLHLRASEISHLAWERGHLIITMRNAARFIIRDWMGDAYEVEAQVLAAIGAALSQQDRTQGA
jgi:hypothetical protein